MQIPAYQQTSDKGIRTVQTRFGPLTAPLVIRLGVCTHLRSALCCFGDILWNFSGFDCYFLTYYACAQGEEVGQCDEIDGQRS